MTSAILPNRKEHYVLSRGTAGYKFKLLTQGTRLALPLPVRMEAWGGVVYHCVCHSLDDLAVIGRKLNKGFLRSVMFQVLSDYWVQIDVRPGC